MNKKNLIVTLLYIGIITQCLFAQVSYKAWVVQHGGSIKVNGSTNINKFCCQVKEYTHLDTILVNKGNNNEASLSGLVQIDLSAFNCGNAMMTADLRKTLKSKDYPYLTIHFLNISSLPQLNKILNTITGWVEIELAGVKKKYLVNYESSGNNSVIKLTGNKQILFSDFGLTPPRKLGGMIKANQELTVEFQLFFSVI